MSDNKEEFENNNPEEEFDFLDEDEDLLEESFSEEEAAPVVSASPTRSKPYLPKFDQKKMIIVGSTVAVVAIGSYLFLNKGSTQEFTTNNTAAIQPPHPVAANMQNKQQLPEPSENYSFSDLQQEQEQQNIPVKEESYNLGQIKTELFEELLESTKQDPNNTAVNDLQSALRRLDQDVNTNVSQIRSLQYTLREISHAINTINKSLNNLDKRIYELSDGLDDVNDNVSGVKKIIADEDLDITSQKVINETIKYQEPEYTVYAVVSGRAWLKTKSGSMVYVTEGDTLGKYGQVSSIDVANHIVSTSSGTSFR